MGGALAIAGKAPEVLGDAAVVGMIGDDNRFLTPGWDVAFEDWLATHPGIVYGDDGFQHERLPTAWWLSRALVDAFGVTEPGLRHYYMDNYWLELGQATGSLHYMAEVSIDHLHPIAHKAPDDGIYARSRRWARIDSVYFRRWKVGGGLRRDVARLRVILAGNRRRVLADWHHPALWESLRLLFEDRFGWELFSPFGGEWLQHGWRLAEGTPGWSAERYLAPSMAEDLGDHFETDCAEYPGTVRKLVTWPQAQASRWDFVLCSVPCHQASFYTLSRQLGAQLIHQVGNARHAVDPRIPQTVLASARLNLRGMRLPKVVPYHQEFSRELFSFRPAIDRRRVGAFMLRLESTSGPYGWLADAIGDDWTDYGGDSPDAPGYLSPMRAVADAMAGCGWVWHDKRIGDGYGHVLHNAAALGRPLIGHASNFRGLTGEPYWQDLKTCIDLDRHDPAEAVNLHRAISADPAWHSEMCEAIAARFAELVDFDAEAQAIRQALG
jgi:hypothetical protein